MTNGPSCYFGTWEPMETEEMVVKKEYLSYAEFADDLWKQIQLLSVTEDEVTEEDVT